MPLRLRLKQSRKAGRQEGRKAGRQEGRKAGRQEGRKAGRQEGRKAGRQEGRKAGRQEGRKAGRQEGRKLPCLPRLPSSGKSRTGSLEACLIQLDALRAANIHVRGTARQLK
ncbi:hypothetical protein CR207_08690 [Chromobacterium violaceum]|nr:hypothetical protein CRN81_08670 [Chromobacterium violaceum]ATP32377.1 hypothetical protein CR207_08690 [Chromobacterium violaceum]